MCVKNQKSIQFILLSMRFWTQNIQHLVSTMRINLWISIRVKAFISVILVGFPNPTSRSIHSTIPPPTTTLSRVSCLVCSSAQAQARLMSETHTPLKFSCSLLHYPQHYLILKVVLFFSLTFLSLQLRTKQRALGPVGFPDYLVF